MNKLWVPRHLEEDFDSYIEQNADIIRYELGYQAKSKLGIENIAASFVSHKGISKSHRYEHGPDEKCMVLWLKYRSLITGNRFFTNNEGEGLIIVNPTTRYSCGRYFIESLSKNSQRPDSERRFARKIIDGTYSVVRFRFIQ